MARKTLLVFSCGWKDLKLYNLYVALRYYSKKKYSFDLDSLIDWNKETTLAFGSPVKLSNTGKTRKFISQNEQHHHNQELHAISILSPVQIRRDNEENDFNSKPKTQKKQISVKGKMTKNREVKNISKNTIPDDIFEFKVPDEYGQGTLMSQKSSKSFSSTTLEQSSKYTLSEGSILKEMTEEGIYIPTIKPMPQRNSNLATNRLSIEMSGPFSSKSVNESVSSNQASSQNSIFYKSTTSDFTRKADATLNTTSKISSKSTNFPPKAEIPIEAPESFKLIADCPLTFDRNDVEFSHKVEIFKADVDKLLMRTPPSVKTILNKTMPELNRFFLNRWREGMIKELGEEGFRIQQEGKL